MVAGHDPGILQYAGGQHPTGKAAITRQLDDDRQRRALLERRAQAGQGVGVDRGASRRGDAIDGRRALSRLMAVEVPVVEIGGMLSIIIFRENVESDL